MKAHRELGPAVAMTFARTVSIVAGAMTTLVTAQGLGAAGRGRFGLAVASLSIAVQFATLGLPNAATLAVGRAASRIARWVTLSALIAVVGGGLTALILVLRAKSWRGEFVMSSTEVILLAMIVPSTLLMLNLQGVVIGVGNAIAVARGELWGRVTSSVLVFGAFVQQWLTVTVVLSTMFVGLLVQSAFLASALWGSFSWQKPERSDLVFLRDTGGRLWIASFLSLGAIRLPVAILGVRASAPVLGNVTLALSASELITSLVAAITVIGYGEMARQRLVVEQARLGRALMWKALGVGSVAAIGLKVVVAFAIVPALGASYSGLDRAVTILIPGAIAQSAQAAWSQYVVAVGRAGLALFANCCGLAAVVLLMISPFGVPERILLAPLVSAVAVLLVFLRNAPMMRRAGAGLT